MSFYREDFVTFVVMLLNIMTIMIITATIYGGFTMCQVLGLALSSVMDTPVTNLYSKVELFI